MMNKQTRVSSINYHSQGDDVDVYYTQKVGQGSRGTFKVTLDRMLLSRLHKTDGLIEYLER